MHGHDFLVVASGKGPFTPSVLSNIQKINPTRRDVVTLPVSDPGDPNPGGYLVIAFPLDNPGIWVHPSPRDNTDNEVLHCHIAWHISMGLGMQFVERMDAIPGNVGVTEQWEKNCVAWNAYQNKVKPEQDDSGI
jgi:FtsP/CotA-like multicopper oxidase with cupredoxin domain